MSVAIAPSPQQGSYLPPLRPKILMELCGIDLDDLAKLLNHGDRRGDFLIFLLPRFIGPARRVQA